MQSVRLFFSAAVFVALWWLADRCHWLNPFVIPAPARVLDAVSELFRSGDLLKDLVQSLRRVSVGFFLATILGVPLGFMLGLNHRFRSYFEPALQLLKPIPPIAWTPLAILSFGLGNGPAFGLTAIAAFFPIVFSIYAGTQAIATRHYDLARVHGATRRQTFFAITWPATLPHVLRGLRLGLGFAWMAVVAAEMIAAGDGLGHLIESGQNLLRPESVFVGMALIGLTGAAMDRLLKIVEKQCVRWR